MKNELGNLQKHVKFSSSFNQGCEKLKRFE